MAIFTEEVVTKIKADSSDFLRGAAQTQAAAAKMGTQVALSTDKARASMARMGAQSGQVAASLTNVLGVTNPMVSKLASLSSGVTGAAAGLSGMAGAAGAVGRGITAMLGPIGIAVFAIQAAIAIWEKLTASQEQNEEQTKKNAEAHEKEREAAKALGEELFTLEGARRAAAQEEAAAADREFRRQVRARAEFLIGAGVVSGKTPADIAAAFKQASQEIAGELKNTAEGVKILRELEKDRAEQAKRGREERKKDLEAQLAGFDEEKKRQEGRIAALEEEAGGNLAVAEAVKLVAQRKRESLQAEKDLRTEQATKGLKPSTSFLMGAAGPEDTPGMTALRAANAAFGDAIRQRNAAMAMAGVNVGALLATEQRIAEVEGRRVELKLRLNREGEIELEREKELFDLDTQHMMTAEGKLQSLRAEKAELRNRLARLPPGVILEDMQDVWKRLAEIHQEMIANLFGPNVPPERMDLEVDTFPGRRPLLEENALREERNKLIIAGVSVLDAENEILGKKALLEKNINELLRQGIDMESARKIAAEQSLETFTRFNVTMDEAAGALGNWVAGFGTAEEAARKLGGYLGTEFMNIMGVGMQAAMRQAIGASVQFTHANAEAQRQAKAMELTAGQAFKAAARDAIVAVASQAAVKAVFATAEGLFALAHGNGPAAAGFFASAHMYASVAGVAAAAAIAMGPVRKTIPDTGGGGAGAFSTDRPTPEGGGPQEINITVNVAPGSSPEDVGRAIVQQIQAFERDQNRKVLVN